MNLHIKKSRGVEGVWLRVVIPKGVRDYLFRDYLLRVGGKEGRRGLYTYNKPGIPPTLKD